MIYFRVGQTNILQMHQNEEIHSQVGLILVLVDLTHVLVGLRAYHIQPDQSHILDILIPIQAGQNLIQHLPLIRQCQLILIL